MGTDMSAIAETVTAIHRLLTELTDQVGVLARQLAGPAVSREPPTDLPEQPRDLPDQLPDAPGRQPDPLEQRWAELGRVRSELAGTAVPVDLPQQIRLTLSRLPAAVSEGWRRSLAAGESRPSAVEAQVRARLDGDVTGIAGDRYPELRAALSGIGVVACLGTGLGQIDLTVGVGGPWLRPFLPGDFGTWWQKLCDWLGLFADDDRAWQDRQDAVVMLDMTLRTVVPAGFSPVTGPRIAPPAPDSEWVRLLDGCLADICDFCGKNGFRVGHSRAGIKVRDSEDRYHVDNNQSLRQPVPPGDKDAHYVLWPLRAWLGRAEADSLNRKEKLLNVVKARVVYGQPR